MINLVSSWLFQAIDSFVKRNPKVFVTTKSCQWKKWVSADALRASFTWICSSCWHLAQGVEELNGSWIWGHQVWKTALWNRTFAGSCQPTDRSDYPKIIQNYFFRNKTQLPSAKSQVSICLWKPMSYFTSWCTVIHAQLGFSCDPARWWLRNQPFSNEWS